LQRGKSELLFEMFHSRRYNDDNNNDNSCIINSGGFSNRQGSVDGGQFAS